jgi:hypothetical protein
VGKTEIPFGIAKAFFAAETMAVFVGRPLRKCKLISRRFL